MSFANHTSKNWEKYWWYSWVRFAGENPGEHGPRVHRAPGRRRVDGIVHQRGGVRGTHKASKGQVVVPGDHGELAVLLIEVVVVDHRAGVAVKIAHKVVYHKVADDLLHVHHFLQVFLGVQLLQAGDEPVLVAVGDVGFSVVKDILVAAVRVVGVEKGGVVAAHREVVVSSSPGHLRSLGFRHLALCAWGKAFLSRKAAFRAVWRGGGSLLAVCGSGGGAVGFLSCFLLPISQGEGSAVAPASAHALAVGLKQLPIVAAVVALEEGFFHALHRQVQAPVLAVYGNPGSPTRSPDRRERVPGCTPRWF